MVLVFINVEFYKVSMAELRGRKVVVSKDFDSISEQGFGDLKKGKLELASFEALYLLEKNRIKLKLTFKQLLKEFKRKDKLISKIYAVFKDLRVAGYIARDAKTTSQCFRVYARGARPGEEPARYLLWVLEKRNVSTKHLREMVEKAHAVRKRPVFAVVEKSDITYFKIDSTKF
ncbi:MAG: hypothetical protein ABIH76_05185 [Candidatus Bathyarchaeota archaeon]